MADIHIVREHGLGLPQARKLAFRWAEVAEKKMDMDCTYEEGKVSDVVSFKRPGASGELKVTKDRFELVARLGLLLGMFKGKIESEIVRNLDELLQQEDPLHAFEEGLASHEARKHAKPARPHAEPHKAAAKAVAKVPAARKK
ncbi:polyhydroxyalkanoic acid system family protein [Ramlibacter sp. PS3R-8]|uniref:polyhydroxyalkanoic acid system family protein n=1 Tax=Ramlibacter sp. PS3R-8 TaxID=3133437 RepID=UPI0030AC2A24